MNLIESKIGLSGEFRLILRDENLKAIYDSGWGRNTILDVGLDTIGGGANGTENPFNFWHVGNSAAAVTEGQTGLQGWIASSTSNQGADVGIFNNQPPWEYSLTRVHRFFAGTINDTVREVGAGSDSANNSNFYARHLVNPVVPVGINQVLDVAYKHTIWPPLGDVLGTGVLVMEGEPYDTILRGAELNRTNVNNAMATMGISGDGGSSDQRIYDGNIGDNLNQPSGDSVTSWGGANDTNVAYVMSNHYRDANLAWDLNEGNGLTLGDIRSILFRFTGSLIQIQFDQAAGGTTPGLALPKDNTKTMDLTFRQSWVRHV